MKKIEILTLIFSRLAFFNVLLNFCQSKSLAQMSAVIDYKYFSPSSNFTNLTRRIEVNGLLSSGSSENPIVNGQAFVLVDVDQKYDGCRPSVNSRNVSGGVAIVHRGGDCTFSVKITRAKQLGAAAVIIYEPTGSGISLINMVQNDTKIFSFYVQQTIGAFLFNLTLENRTMLNISLRSTDFENSFDGSSSAWFGTRSATIFIVVSISVLVFLCFLWFVVYTCHRYRSRTSKDRLQKRLNSAAKKALAKITLEKIREENSSPESCVICLDSMKTGDVIRKLICQHSFHQICVDPWLLNHRHCPLCNLDILSAYRVSLSARPRRSSVAPENSRLSLNESSVQTTRVSSSIPTISSSISDDGTRIVALHSEQTNSNQ